MSATETQRNEWLVIRIEPHHLYRARRELAGVAVVYCPLRVRFYRVRQKHVRSEGPLFVSYAFALVKNDPGDWHKVREAIGVEQILTGAGEPENGRPWVCDPSDVRHIRRLEKAGEFDEAKRYFDMMNAKRARKKAQKAKKYRIEDLKEVINIISETAA